MPSLTDTAIRKAIQEGHEQERMFVVEAPPQERSVPNSPTTVSRKGDGSDENSLRDDEEGDVFPRMEMDDEVT